MSQVTEQSVRFQTALASIKLIQASAVLDLTEDDFDFLTSNKVWIATEDRKSGSAGMPRPISYAVFCLKKKKKVKKQIALQGMHDQAKYLSSLTIGRGHRTALPTI